LIEIASIEVVEIKKIDELDGFDAFIKLARSGELPKKHIEGASELLHLLIRESE